LIEPTKINKNLIHPYYVVVCAWGLCHHPLLLERICPQIYRVDLKQQPYSCFENYSRPSGSNDHLFESSNKSKELVSTVV